MSPLQLHGRAFCSDLLDKTEFLTSRRSVSKNAHYTEPKKFPKIEPTQTDIFGFSSVWFIQNQNYKNIYQN